jgi:hypothetical protein
MLQKCALCDIILPCIAFARLKTQRKYMKELLTISCRCEMVNASASLNECTIFLSLKNVVFWDVAQCGFIIDRRFGGTYRLYFQGYHLTIFLT